MWVVERDTGLTETSSPHGNTQLEEYLQGACVHTCSPYGEGKKQNKPKKTQQFKEHLDYLRKSIY